MNINRSLVKSQAKQIIKGRVLKLFLIAFVVSILTQSAFFISYYNYAKQQNSSNNSSSYSDFFNYGNENNQNSNSDSNSSSSSNSNQLDRSHFDNFTGSLTLNTSPLNSLGTNISTVSIRTLGLANLIFMPLTVTLMGMFILIVRGKQLTLKDEFNFVFGKAFDRNYLNKFLMMILKSIIILLMCCLFLIPGIIFNYKYYFAEAVMLDNPDLSPIDAIKLSRKITKGHRGELFALDLSFLGWFLLTGITFGILSIYVVPYYQTTKALYYENFRIRSFQEGKVTAVDYMSDTEKYQYYQSQPQNNQTYYQPPHSSYGSGMDNDYYNNQF
jgi:uncharacterized membrane protein